MRRSLSVSIFDRILSVQSGDALILLGKGITPCLEADDGNGGMFRFDSELTFE